METMNAPSRAQFTMFILKRSAFSNSGSEAMISLYFGFVFFAISAAVPASYPNTAVSCDRNDAPNSAHIPMGIPAYSIFYSP